MDRLIAVAIARIILVPESGFEAKEIKWLGKTFQFLLFVGRPQWKEQCEGKHGKELLHLVGALTENRVPPPPSKDLEYSGIGSLRLALTYLCKHLVAEDDQMKAVS